MIDLAARARLRTRGPALRLRGAAAADPHADRDASGLHRAARRPSSSCERRPSAAGRPLACSGAMVLPARPAVHRRPDRRALRDHPGRPGDRRAGGRSRCCSPTRCSARCCCARRAARRGGASTRAGRGAGSRARGARRRAGDLRRRAAADARASSPTSSARCSCCPPTRALIRAVLAAPRRAPARVAALGEPARRRAGRRPRRRRRRTTSRAPPSTSRRPPDGCPVTIDRRPRGAAARAGPAFTRRGRRSRSATRRAERLRLARLGLRRRAPSAAGSCCCSAAASRWRCGPGRRRRPTTRRLGRRARGRRWTRRSSSRCARWTRRASTATTAALRPRASRPSARRPSCDGGDAAARPAAWRATSSCAACTARRVGGQRSDGRLPRPARALVGRAGLGRHDAGAHARRVARRRRSASSLAAVRPARRRRTPTRRSSRRSSLEGDAAGASCASPSRGSRRPTTREGRQRRAGLELWVDDEDGYAAPRRRRGRVRHDARPRPAAPGLRVLPLAHGGPRGRRPLRRAAPRDVSPIAAGRRDFGGVLTSPLLAGVRGVQDDLASRSEALGRRCGGDRARRRQPPLRARARAHDRGRVPRPDRRELAAELGPAGRACTRSPSATSDAWSPTRRCSPGRGLRGARLPHGAAHEQRARVGAALARDAPGRRDLRARRRLGLRRAAQARPARSTS